MHSKAKETESQCVAGIWPLSAGAKLKQRDRVLGKGERKNSFIALPGKGGSQQGNALKTVSPPPPQKRITRSFIVKRRKTGFQIGIRIGTNMHSFFFG